MGVGNLLGEGGAFVALLGGDSGAHVLIVLLQVSQLLLGRDRVLLYLVAVGCVLNNFGVLVGHGLLGLDDTLLGLLDVGLGLGDVFLGVRPRRVGLDEVLGDLRSECVLGVLVKFNFNFKFCWNEQQRCTHLLLLLLDVGELGLNLTGELVLEVGHLLLPVENLIPELGQVRVDGLDRVEHVVDLVLVGGENVVGLEEFVSDAKSLNSLNVGVVLGPLEVVLLLAAKALEGRSDLLGEDGIELVDLGLLLLNGFDGVELDCENGNEIRRVSES